MNKQKKIRMMQWVAAGLFLLFGLIPLLYGNFHIGTYVLLLYGMFLLIIMHSKNKVVKRLLALLLAAGTAGGTVISLYMIQKAYFSPPVAGEPYTVLVLGCQVRGDEPSLMLKRRLNAAYTYLKDNPQAQVIVCGGVGDQTTFSEAEVMQRFLIARGIEAERIHLEDQSHSTQENINFAADIIREKGLPKTVAIATDGFHQARAAIYANQAGLSPCALPSRTPEGLLPAYWIREWFGLLKAIVLDGSAPSF